VGLLSSAAARNMRSTTKSSSTVVAIADSRVKQALKAEEGMYRLRAIASFLVC
jgi:hypothetical protein